MSYDDFLDTLFVSIDALPDRARAAVFWILGAGLARSLPPAEWADWMADASDVGYRFVVAGTQDDRCGAIMSSALESVDEDDDELVGSVGVCLTTPIIICMEHPPRVGQWVEEAFSPLLTRISLTLFKGIAVPGNKDDRDRIFAHPDFQAAAAYTQGLVASLVGETSPSPALISAQLAGVHAIRP